MGDYIKWYEKKFYKDSIFIGMILTLTLLFIVFLITFTIENFIQNTIVLALLGSTTIAASMLKKSVSNVIDDPQSIQYLVSRDTQNLSDSDINKAAIETYAENLSDGVIAPIFYMLLFGLPGAFVYKAINTLDSMVGYRSTKYENFGKFSARLDDIANYIPSRITAILISLLFFSTKAFKNFYSFGKMHKSPNAGHPISAMAISLNISLGGPTSYFGKIENKPYFGEGKKDITIQDIQSALKFNQRFDMFALILLGVVLYA